MARNLHLTTLALLLAATMAACGSSPAIETPEPTPLPPEPTAIAEPAGEDDGVATAVPGAAEDDTSQSGASLDIGTQASITDKRLSGFAAFVEEIRQDYDVPGVAVAIVQGSEIVFADGFGVRDIRGNDPVTPETLFHIGSTNKSVTAMLIASLVDDGLLGWDTPVVEIVPDFRLSDPEATEQITIRHLLSMSSGIPDYAEDEFDVETSSAEDMFDLLAETPLLDGPGEVFSYSNISGAASGYIGVLAAGGQLGQLYEGYAQLLQERVFDPIGMKTATLSVEEARANPNHSASHEFDEHDQVVTAESYDFTGDPLAPSGSIKASALDMARYMSTQVNRGVAPNGTRVVSEQNLTETWQPHIAESQNSSYAMGWVVQTQDGIEVISHEGSYDGFTSVLVFVPEANAGMVVLNNLDDPGDFLEEMRQEFVQLLID